MNVRKSHRGTFEDAMGNDYRSQWASVLNVDPIGRVGFGKQQNVRTVPIAIPQIHVNSLKTAGERVAFGEMTTPAMY